MINVKDVWKNQAEYIENEYGTEKLKRGRWRIISYASDNTHGLWHQCEKTEWDMYLCEYRADVGSDWALNGTRKIKPNWHCENCFAIPPATIVAVWCLLEPDMTSQEVTEVLEMRADKERDSEARYEIGPSPYGPWQAEAIMPEQGPY